MPPPPTAADRDPVQEAVAVLRSQLPRDFTPEVGVVLGSGLGAFAHTFPSLATFDYSAIPHFPVSTAVGHAGRLVCGTVGNTPVAVMAGRVHRYEGYALADVVFPVRVLAALGTRILLLTNAAGGINTGFRPGALVLISDHINLLGNPLIGPNDPQRGPRFPDMTDAYSPLLRRHAHAAASASGVSLQEGVYLAVTGPSYETPAEIRAFRTWGADLVGMSTVPEVIAARHLGLAVLGLSVVTNMAAGILPQPIDHAEVLEIGQRVQDALFRLLRELIPRLTEALP